MNSGLESLEVLRCSPDKMSNLRGQLISSLSPMLAGRAVMHLDVPVHLNVGDMLIDMGTDELFRLLKVKHCGRIAMFDQSRLFAKKKLLSRDVVLILHGGGNFGDIYPNHQEFRERVIRNFPDNPICVFPQSVHFNNENVIAGQMLVYRNHRNLMFYVRDQYSFDLLKTMLNPNQLAILPDLAHMLYGVLPAQNEAIERRLLFRRRDVEAVDTGVDGGFDWTDLIDAGVRKRFRALKKRMKWQGRLRIDLGGHQRWQSFRDSVINIATSKYSNYGLIDSDRLHGVILAQLMAKPTVTRDNSYGKIQRYCKSHFNS